MYNNEYDKNIVCIVQARMGSKRLPGKVLKKIGDYFALELTLKRLRRSEFIDKIIVATTLVEDDDFLCGWLARNGYDYFRGCENDVLGRYYESAKFYSADVIVRITGDCPFIDVGILDSMVSEFLKKNYSYFTNRSPATFPDGLDVEVFSFPALELANSNAKNKYYREHVTPYFYKDNKHVKNFASNSDLSKFRLTLDTNEDLVFLNKLFSAVEYNPLVVTDEILEKYLLLEAEQQKSQIRDIGSVHTSGQKVWERAKKTILGGTSLLSKNPNLHAPNIWPTYFDKTSGITIWDLDGNAYLDCYLMGVGTNILGYNNVAVDTAVCRTIADGNLSTLNCKQEVELAEKLLSLDNWAGKVKFARTGGEANSIAVRVARAASGKNSVAVCGYHGWHDWYLSANHTDKNSLSGHLIPGLSTIGIPRELAGLTKPFKYNDLEAFEKIISNNDVGAIKMEVCRNYEPDQTFLQSIRKIATEQNIVLIFDECSSGFRETSSGLYKKYNIEPDMVTYGKTLGNGYAITAVLGRDEIMDAAIPSFISSTFWTERIGPTAALAALKVHKELEAHKIVTELGLEVQKGWKDIAESNSVNIEIRGIPALSSFTFTSTNNNSYKAFLVQEMLKRGYLAGNQFYLSTCHTHNIIDTYLGHMNDVFAQITKFENEEDDVNRLIDKPVMNGFGRLN